MHNYYSVLYHRAVFNLLQRKKGVEEACLFARSAAVGTQQYPVHWGGDNAASYVSMAESLRGGLSFCQSGFGFWAHDIGGFNNTPTPDLYKRWVAFGLLSTNSRLHGYQSYRVPWLFDEESTEVLRHFTRLKCTLMPYLYTGAVRVHEEGVPLLQPMMLTFPSDPACLTLDRQYMLGDNLLVAPVFADSGDVQFYVPEGRWTDLQSDKIYDGGRWYHQRYDYFGLPLLVRPGTILPMGAHNGTVEYDYADGIQLRLYGFEDGNETIYQLCNMQGQHTMRIEARRSGGILVVETSGTEAPYTIMLPGIKSVTAVRGASQQVLKNGLELLPESGMTRVEIEL